MSKVTEQRLIRLAERIATEAARWVQCNSQPDSSRTPWLVSKSEDEIMVEVSGIVHGGVDRVAELGAA